MRTSHWPCLRPVTPLLRGAAVLVALALAAGCGNDETPPDASVVTDLAVPPVDQSRPVGDGDGLRDLSARDLAAPPDQSNPLDLRPPPDLTVPPDLVDPPDLTVIGGACNCANNQFCKYAQVGSCAGAGSCKQRPQVCGLVLDPVCGCDGNDYDNECMANGAGTDIAHKGMCP